MNKLNNKSSVFCIIMGIFGFILGVAYACTLVLIPIAIYCFLGAKTYMDASNLTDSQLTFKRKTLLGYAIFFSIVGFPIGLLSIAPAHYAASNDVTITSVDENQPVYNQDEPVQSQPSAPKREEESPTSKEETLEKLKHLLDEGLITPEEYERAKHDLG